MIVEVWEIKLVGTRKFQSNREQLRMINSRIKFYKIVEIKKYIEENVIWVINKFVEEQFFHRPKKFSSEKIKFYL